MKYITETREGQSTVNYCTDTKGDGLCYHFLPDKANAVQFDDAEAERLVTIMNPATTTHGFGYQVQDCS